MRRAQTAMAKRISDEMKKLIAIGLIFIALSFCAVYTSVQIGSEAALAEITEFTATEADYHQRISTQLEAINLNLDTIATSLSSGNESVQTTLKETMEQMTAMNAVFLDYGRRMGILVQEGADV